MLAYKHDGMVRLIGRQGVDHMKRFRDLTAAVAPLPYDRLIIRSGGVRRAVGGPTRVAARPGGGAMNA
jgi:hypothetical protein